MVSSWVSPASTHPLGTTCLESVGIDIGSWLVLLLLLLWLILLRASGLALIGLRRAVRRRGRLFGFGHGWR
jgi:hypothetical protein